MANNHYNDLVITPDGSAWQLDRTAIESSIRPISIDDYTVVEGIPPIREILPPVCSYGKYHYVGITTDCYSLIVLSTKQEIRLESKIVTFCALGVASHGVIILLEDKTLKYINIDIQCKMSILENVDQSNIVDEPIEMICSLDNERIQVVESIYVDKLQYTPQRMMAISSSNRILIIGRVPTAREHILGVSATIDCPVNHQNIEVLRDGIILTKSNQIYSVARRSYDSIDYVLNHHQLELPTLIDIAPISNLSIIVITEDQRLLKIGRATIPGPSENRGLMIYTNKLDTIRNRLLESIIPVRFYNANITEYGVRSINFRSIDGRIYRLGIDGSLIEYEIPVELLVDRRSLMMKPPLRLC